MKDVPLTPTDKELLGQLCGFAERYGENGVYMNFIRSVTRNDQRYVVLVAIGDQADVVQKILLDAQQPESGIEIVSDLNKIDFSGGIKW